MQVRIKKSLHAVKYKRPEPGQEKKSSPLEAPAT